MGKIHVRRQTLLTGGIILAASSLAGLAFGQIQFQAATNYPVQLFPIGVTSADFNGDTFPDLAVSNGNAAMVSLLANDRQGGFAEAVDVPLGGLPFGIASAPLDADDDDDIVVTLAHLNRVQLVWNVGDGQFAAGPTIIVGDTPRSVATTNLDGVLGTDLIVANRESDTVSILRNQGAGTFMSVVHYPCGERPREVAAGDMNGDGRPDVIVANQRSTDVAVLLNLGNGVLGQAVSAPLPGGLDPETLAIGDLDGDLDLDVAVAGLGAFGGKAVVLLNNGAGGLTVHVELDAGGDPAAVRIGELNRDAFAELVVADRHADEVRAYANASGAVFAEPALFRVGPDPYYITLDDFNLDGRIDVVTPNALADNVSVLLNSTGAAAGDMDGDGDLDTSDLTLFVTVLTARSADPLYRNRADLDGNGVANGRDIAPFLLSMSSR